MNRKLHTILIAVALATVPAVLAQSTNDLVRAEVRTEMSSDRKDIKGSMADTKTQKITLLIALSGKPKSPETRMVKWAIFGRDLKRNDVSTIESGEEPLALDSTGRQTIESKVASTTSTPDHSIVSRSGGSRNSRSRTSVRKVESSGVKYLGYGVVVKDGATVVGKAFSGQSLEAEMPR
jgi:hypothetical protein